MKKLGTTVLAVLACVAVGAATLAIADTKKVKTKATVEYNVFTQGTAPYYEQTSAFSGKVKAKKGCKKNRKVKIVPAIGKQVKSDKKGRYTISLSDPAPNGTTRTRTGTLEDRR